MKRDEEEVGKSGNGFFKFEDGKTARLRVLTEPTAIATHFLNGNKPAVCYGVKKGCPWHGDNAPLDEKGNPKDASIKYTAYVLDHDDSKIKLADLPWTVVKKIAGWEEDEEWGFKGYPMPFGIKVKFDKKKAGAAMYEVDASPNRIPVSDVIMGQLAEKMAHMTPADLIQKKKDAQMEMDKIEGRWISPEEMEAKEVDRQEKFKAHATAEQKKMREGQNDGVAYPTEEINAEDIPF